MDNKENIITAWISLENDVLSYVPLKFSNNQHREALLTQVHVPMESVEKIARK